MFREEDHKRVPKGSSDGGRFTKSSDGVGGTHEPTEAEKKRLKEIGIQDTIPLQDETMPRSLSARWANEDIRMPDGKLARFVEGSKLHHKEVFAGKGTRTPIRDVERLVRKYGGIAENWQKVKGFGTFELNGKSFEGEIHWYEEPSVGRKEIKFKDK